ncbi:hypothetical protein EYF80_018935 [Liparis tanakae]|uniref:Uncharacterized protein n=1 Tax=Liparis tanakae TaxID=230148 RepID=A0A4Z2HZ06_9TELE|nr:hypothetical protein EYF80_018935 [Liparis tanakae]
MWPSGMLGNEGWQGGIQASDYEPCWEERKDLSCEGCARLFTFAGEVFSFCSHAEGNERDELPASHTSRGERKDVAKNAKRNPSEI